MDKGMLEVKVATQGLNIFIEQPNYSGNDPDSILLTSEQVDTVIAWLKEAKEEVNGKASS